MLEEEEKEPNQRRRQQKLDWFRKKNENKVQRDRLEKQPNDSCTILLGRVGGSYDTASEGKQKEEIKR